MITRTNSDRFVNSYLLVGIGGFIGAILRFGVSEIVGTPQATLIVNSLGSLILGIVIAALSNELISKEFALLVGTGIVGAFTTMSTFSVETIELWSENQTTAVGYVILTMAICPLLALGGWKIGEIIS